MSSPKRYLFDECIGKPLMGQLRALVCTQAEFIHIVDKFHQGVLDPDWIPQVAKEGGYVVITGDGGKRSRKKEKLPEICREYGLTHVVLSATLHEKPTRIKVAALVQVWEQVELTHAEKAGVRFNLRYKEAKGEDGSVKLAIVLERHEYRNGGN